MSNYQQIEKIKAIIKSLEELIIKYSEDTKQVEQFEVSKKMFEAELRKLQNI